MEYYEYRPCSGCGVPVRLLKPEEAYGGADVPEYDRNGEYHICRKPTSQED